MAGSGKGNLLLTLVLGTAVAAGMYYAYGKSRQYKPEMPEMPAAASGPAQEALDVAQKMNDLKEFKGAVNLMQKKNEVRTAVDIAVTTRGRIFDAAAFDAAWNRISPEDLQNKSAPELTSEVMARLK